jgi:hypothetical protein
MVYLLELVIFHGYVSHNQVVYFNLRQCHAAMPFGAVPLRPDNEYLAHTSEPGRDKGFRLILVFGKTCLHGSEHNLWVKMEYT